MARIRFLRRTLATGVSPMIRFTCPTCKTVLQAPGEKAGEKVACPKCGQRLLAPNPVKPGAGNKTVLGSLLPDSAGSPTVPALGWLDDVRATEEKPKVPSAPNPPPASAAPIGREDRADSKGVGRAPGHPLANLIPQRPADWVWRLCTPSMLLFSMFLLPLPFLEVSCTTNGQTLMTQSGLQAVYGGYSLSPLADRMPPRDLAGASRSEDKRLEIWPSLVMFLVPLGVLIAAVLCLVLPLGWLRSALAAAVVGAALVLLLGQVVSGFPLENAMIASLAKSDTQRRDDFRNPGFPPRQDEARHAGALLAAAAIQVRLTPWFYLWVLLIAGSLVPLTVERLVEPSRYGSAKMKRTFFFMSSCLALQLLAVVGLIVFLLMVGPRAPARPGAQAPISAKPAAGPNNARCPECLTAFRLDEDTSTWTQFQKMAVNKRCPFCGHYSDVLTYEMLGARKQKDVEPSLDDVLKAMQAPDGGNSIPPVKPD
ncbi:MAG: hypothetical protein ACRELG_02535 [Gemmataceae bacterium]